MGRGLFAPLLALALVLALLVSLMAISPGRAAASPEADHESPATESITATTTNQAAQTSFTFEGGGWGHGVGMSQYGAFGRAAAGQSVDEILKAYYQGISVEQRKVTNNVRVQLSTASSTTASFGARATVKIDGKNVAGVPAWTDIAISRLADRWAITAGNVDICTPQPVPEGADPVPSPCIGRQLRLVVKDKVEQHLTTSEHSYRHGRLEFTPTGSNGTTFHIVLGQLTMDEYLYGLAEMPSSWPFEALKAQAIAGRSYAESRILARRGQSSWTNPFDLYSSTQDQAYAGNSKETGAFSENWVGAVDSTHETVAVHDGRVIDALYGSSTGGHSENSEYVFANFVPYLRGAPDPFDGHENPLGSWTRTYSADELSRWLGADPSTNVGTVQSLSIGGNVGVSGRVNKATITVNGTEGTKAIQGSTFRIVVNRGLGNDGRWSRDDQLLSTNFTYTGPTDKKPFGKLTKVKVRSGKKSPTVRVAGWAIDPDTSAAIKVRITVDGKTKTRTAKRNRKNLEKHGLGTRHGFRIDVGVSAGTHEVCAVALNATKGGSTTKLGCRTVTVADQPAPANDIPIGELEIVRSASTSGSNIRVAGWALDPTTNDPIKVAIDLDRTEVARITASFEHDGLEEHGRGNNHGFDVTIPSTPGAHQVCARAISADGKVAVILGCQNVTLS